MNHSQIVSFLWGVADLIRDTFKRGKSNAEFWLRRQATYDLVRARQQEHRIHVERYQPQPTA